MTSQSSQSNHSQQPVSWYIVRHGQTSWNSEGRIQGHADVPLSDRGRAQIRQLDLRLTAVEFSAIYASDLSRTMETAAILASLSVRPQAAPELREFSYGEWEGLTLKEAEASDPALFAKRIARSRQDFAAPGGETTTDVLNRVRRFVERTRACSGPGDRLLVAAHGGSIRALLVCLLDLPIDHFWRFRIDPASLGIVRDFDDTAVLDLWNDTSHLSSGSSE